jgi:hypothetical protein
MAAVLVSGDGIPDLQLNLSDTLSSLRNCPPVRLM